MRRLVLLALLLAMAGCRTPRERYVDDPPGLFRTVLGAIACAVLEGTIGEGGGMGEVQPGVYRQR